MGRSGLSGLMIAGALFVVLGIAGLAVPMFTTKETKNVAKVGPLAVQSTEETPHSIPPIVPEGAIAVGVVLLAAGLFRRA